MKKYKLTRVMQYTETAEIESESWDKAKEVLESDSDDFLRNFDDTCIDANIEYLGE